MTIIDCHGHWTTPPAALAAYRTEQLAGGRPAHPRIGDGELAASVLDQQIRLMDERGIDLTILSPKASAMGHHEADLRTAADWARVNNDLVARVAALFPDRFALVCQLPQTPDGGVAAAVAELRRCVLELGAVGCNLNPDPSGGAGSGPPLTDPAWYPMYEAMVELDVPAMVHVSASQRAAVHTLGAHYLNADTTVWMQLVERDLFPRFPGLRLVIPHGGGAVPFHWGRFRGLAARLGRPDPVEALLGNVVFDTCVYHPAGMDLLVSTVGAANLVFGSEMLGAVPRLADPDTGYPLDDTRRVLDTIAMDDADRHAILEGNARRVYPRLPARIAA